MQMKPMITCLIVSVSLLIGGASRAVHLAHTRVTAQSSTVRIALVNTPGDVIQPLLPDFEKQTGYRASIVYTGEDPYTLARNGGADLVISHYGHSGVEPFVVPGLGLWPQVVLANQIALLGPASDPARVRGLTDAVEAFRRISQSKSPFLVSGSNGAKYFADILWIAAGRPDKGPWYMDSNLEPMQAVQMASMRGAYVTFGIVPALRLKRQGMLNLEPLVTGDPLFQRIMVAIVVNPVKITGVNVDGAKALQSYLIAPATQAQIRAFRYPDFDQQAWWPHGRDNNPSD